MYTIQLMATKRCNQKCYYCTTYNKTDDIEVDIDYLKWVLNQCPNNICVELTGGEIGLLKNLDDFYRTVKTHENVNHIIALSNGLVRKIGVDWLDEVEYWEHLIYQIKGKEIIKFYNLDLDQKHTYIIVTSETTVRSLFNNWEYFESMGLFKSNFFYKMLNHKSSTGIKSYFDSLCNFYLKLNDHNHCKRMLIYYYVVNKFKSDFKEKRKRLCQKYPPNIYVDLQKKQLGHCAININSSIIVDFNKENLDKMMRGEINENSYCKNCYSFDDGVNRSPLKNRSYQ